MPSGLAACRWRFQQFPAAFGQPSTKSTGRFGSRQSKMHLLWLHAWVIQVRSFICTGGKAQSGRIPASVRVFQFIRLLLLINCLVFMCSSGGGESFNRYCRNSISAGSSSSQYSLSLQLKDKTRHHKGVYTKGSHYR